MQITFDPLDTTEVQSVQACLSVLHALKPMRDIGAADIAILNAQRGKPGDPVVTILPHADRPDVGASPEVPPAPSAAPLAPVPSIAAAELFPTAPAAGTVSVPPAPPVPAPPVAAVPPAPPVPSAPASTVNPVPGVEADSTGLPWDERIHSGTKATNADGSWRKRRGLNDEALIKAVEAELRAGKVAPAASAAPLSQTPTVGTVTEPGESSESRNSGSATFAPVPALPPVSAPSAATAVVPPPPVIPAGPSVVPAPPVPAGVPTPTTPPVPVVTAPALTEGFEIAFGPLMSLITGNIASGKLTEPQVHEIMARPGCELRPEQIGVLAGDEARRNMVGHALTQLLGV